MKTMNAEAEATVTIEDAVKALAGWRRIEADARQALDDIRKSWEASSVWLKWSASLKEAREQVSVCTQQLKAAALSAGDKHPHPATTIRQATKLNYDERQAIAWCIEHLPQALKLDSRLFEKHARAVAATDPIPFVEIASEAQVAIATDLSAYLEPGDDKTWS